MITGGHMRKKRLTRKQRIMRKRITIATCIAVVGCCDYCSSSIVIKC